MADEDTDGKINDGCPTIAGWPRPGSQCSNATDDDVTPVDGIVNDGCPNSGAAESSCFGTADDDADGRVNDGCVVSGAAEVEPVLER